MLTVKSKEFNKRFLLTFTKELIKHSGEGDLIILNEIIKEEEREEKYKQERLIHPPKKDKIFIEIERKINRQISQGIPKKVIHLKTPIMRKPQIQRRKPPFRKPGKRILNIPRQRMAPQLDYLRPTPTNVEIDLGKLNSMVKDPMVQIIECGGADENIIIKGNKGVKKTKVILNKEEISEVINKFSKAAKIPVQEGVFRVAIGRLILTAIISEVISSKFIIKKMMVHPGFRR